MSLAGYWRIVHQIAERLSREMGEDKGLCMECKQMIRLDAVVGTKSPCCGGDVICNAALRAGKLRLSEMVEAA